MRACIPHAWFNNVLHGFPFASVHQHVVSKNLSHFDSLDASSDSRCFCLALKVLLIADCLEVDEQAAGNCGVHMTSGEALFKERSFDSTSSKESGRTGNSLIPVNLVMINVVIFT